jgi:hypothetical protein
MDADLVPGSKILSTLDPGWKIGSGTNIPDPQHWFIFIEMQQTRL